MTRDQRFICANRARWRAPQLVFAAIAVDLGSQTPWLTWGLLLGLSAMAGGKPCQIDRKISVERCESSLVVGSTLQVCQTRCGGGLPEATPACVDPPTTLNQGASLGGCSGWWLIQANQPKPSKTDDHLSAGKHDDSSCHHWQSFDQLSYHTQIPDPHCHASVLVSWLHHQSSNIASSLLPNQVATDSKAVEDPLVV